MMKYLKILFLSMAVIGLTVSGAQALTNDGNALGGPLPVEVRTVAVERISPTTGYTDDYFAFITAVTNIQPVGAQINFTLSGGATFAEPTLIELWDAGPDNIPFTIDDAMILANPNTIGGGNSFISFTIPAAYGPVAALQNVFIYRSIGLVTPRLYINLPAALTTASTVRMATASSVAGELADTDTIYTVFQQFFCGAIAGADAIDVNKDLKRFFAAAATDLRSRTVGTFAFTNLGGSVTALNITNAQISFVLTGDMTGVSTIQLVNDNTTTAVGTFAIGTGTASLNIPLPTSIGVNYDILITVNGTDILDDRAFNLNISIAAANDIVQGVTLMDANNGFAVGAVQAGLRAILWATNGTQFYFPYVRDDTTLGISTAIRIENVTGGAKNYWVLANNPATGKWTMIKSKVAFAAGGVVILLGSGIMTDAAAIVTLPVTGFAARVVVDEINTGRNVACYATQYIGGFYRHIPALKWGVGVATD